MRKRDNLKSGFHGRNGGDEMSMKFEIGTKVRIRTDLKTNKLYNGIDFSIDMKPYMGKEAQIVDCSDSAYFLDIDNRFWAWGEKMLKKISSVSTYENEKIIYGDIETGERNKVNIFRSEHNNSINTVSGDNVYAEIHNCLDTQKDYVDIEIDATFDKESLKFIIETFQEFYDQMN